MELKDSGSRREFNSGAVRDIAEGKGRCDLLPLVVISCITKDSVFSEIEQYIRTGNLLYLYGIVEDFSEKRYGDIYTALLETAKQYEDGASKYSERNWEKGIPLHCYIDSGIRHYIKFLRGDTDEPHGRAFLWNMLGAVWTHIYHPELIDLPFKEKNDD